MSDNYVRRLNYSNGQLLEVSDFADEQAYHVAQRRLHNLQLHGVGIVAGLEVDVTDDAIDVTIRPGAAIDHLGREIVLTGPAPEKVLLKDRKPPLRGTTVFLTIAYDEQDDESPEMVAKNQDTGKMYSRRRVQRPLLETPTAPATDGSRITLAKLTIDTSGKITLDASVRTRSGGLHPATALEVKQVRVGGKLGIDAATLSFRPVDAADAGTDGITWYPARPTDYGIHRTAGDWTGDFQQLRVSWATGIVLDPGSAHGKSHVEVRGKGLRVTAGGLALGAGAVPGAAGSLLIEGNAAIGAPSIGKARLDIGGKGNAAGGDPSLQLRAGNDADKSQGVQLSFAYNGGESYRHNIRTRHNSSARAGNAIDFYVWRHAGQDDKDKADAAGSQHVMSLDGGNVGIGTNAPGDYRLKVKGDNSQFDGSVDVTGGLSVAGTLSFGGVERQMIDLYKAQFAIGVQNATMFLRSYKNYAWFVGGAYDYGEMSPGTGGTLQMALTDGKLGIGTGATGPQARLDVEGDAIVAGVLKGRYKDSDEVKRYRQRSDYVNDKAVAAITRLNAAVVQAWAMSGHSVTDTSPPHLFTFGYRQNGTNPNDLFIADLNTAALKTFVIDHPQHADRYLRHATLEGPEGGVYYRGSARLVGGHAEIRLPPYFEALTRREGRTVLLTNVDGHEPLAVITQGGEKIRDGCFHVASSNARSEQAFDWEVKAVRSDAGELEVEPAKDAVRIERFGPYAYEAGRVPRKG